MDGSLPYPVSAACPKCGNDRDFELRKPEKFIAFAPDRVCKACATRYTPPAPAWAGPVWIMLGLFAAAAGLLGMRLMAMHVSYLIALGVGVTGYGIARLLGAGRTRSASRGTSFDRWYLDVLPALAVVTGLLLLQVFAVDRRDRNMPPPDMTAQTIAFVIILALAWLWTIIGVLGVRVVYYGLSSIEWKS